MRAIYSVLVFLVIAFSCTAESAANHHFVLVGSTPCDAAIKEALRIAVETKCDFMRWNLAIDPARRKTFSLSVDYGEGQPNTSGFTTASHRKITTAGNFETTLENKRETFRLKSPAIDVSLIKLNENLFHVLTRDGTMMLGNAGWSYTLNRSTPLANAEAPPASQAVNFVETVFDGRTPCTGIAAAIEARGESCMKAKWSVTLNRDPSTFAPLTFTIKNVIPDRTKLIEGRWSETKVGKSNSIAYRLEPTAGGPAIVLLPIGDLLFFLDPNGQPLVGNKDFSFTLNRRV